MVHMAAAAVISPGIAAFARVRDVQFTPAVAASQKAGKKGLSTSYGAPSRPKLAGDVIRDQPLVPLVDIPADITIMMIGDQNIPVFLRLSQPLDHTLAPVLYHCARAGAAEHIGASVDRVLQDVQDCVVNRRLPLDTTTIRSVDGCRKHDPLLTQPKMHLAYGTHLIKLREDKRYGVLHPPIRVLVDLILAHTHKSNRDRHKEFAPACLLAQRLMRALSQNGQLHLAHSPFHAKQQAIVWVARIVDAVFVYDQCRDQTAELQKRVPISTVSSQPRRFNRDNGTYAPLADRGKKLLEARPCDA